MKKWFQNLAIAAIAVVLCGTTSFGAAQASNGFPSRTVTFVCAFPAGSGADVLVRYFADKVAKLAGQGVIVENKPGAMSNIAAEYTARAKPDGHTIFVHAGNAIAGNMWMLKKPPIDVTRDLNTIATINKQAFMVTVRKDSPYQTLADLTAAMKQKGDRGSYATNTTSGKVLAEEYKQKAGLNTVVVHYKAAPDSLNDMMSGHVDFGVHDPVFTLSQIRAGRWRALAVGSAERMAGAPDVPTFKEQGLDVQLGWWGAMVPANVPAGVTTTINGWFNEILARPETKTFLEQQGGEAFISTPEQAQALMVSTVEQWKGLVEVAKIPQL
jgi:tripartite-type tricarboxylate transporter receptor subunit TctC